MSDQIHRDHEDLKCKVSRLDEDRKTIEAAIKAPPLGRILRGFDDEIEEIKETLCNSEKKNFDRLQADIRARRALLVSLKSAYKDDLEAAREDLVEFESQNALLLSGEKVKDDNAELLA